MFSSRIAPGFTLVEVLVVLVLVGLTVGLVAPSLFLPEAPNRGTLQGVVTLTRDAALRRGETLLLKVESDGGWLVLGTAAGDSVSGGVLVGTPPWPPLELSIAPSGACGPPLAPRGSVPAQAPVDPLTCRLEP